MAQDRLSVRIVRKAVRAALAASRRNRRHAGIKEPRTRPCSGLPSASELPTSRKFGNDRGKLPARKRHALLGIKYHFAAAVAVRGPDGRRLACVDRRCARLGVLAKQDVQLALRSGRSWSPRLAMSCSSTRRRSSSFVSDSSRRYSLRFSSRTNLSKDAPVRLASGWLSADRARRHDARWWKNTAVAPGCRPRAVSDVARENADAVRQLPTWSVQSRTRRQAWRRVVKKLRDRSHHL